MSRNPMTSLHANREAVVRDQLEEAWLDIEEALAAAELADKRAAAAAAPDVPPPLPASVLAATSTSVRMVRRWRAWTLATAALLSLAAVAFHFLAGGR